MKRAVSYMRISTFGQLDNTSIETQAEKIELHCKLHDIELVKPFKDEAKEVYKEGLSDIMETYSKLEELGYPKEDAANILPLGMSTKIVWKINLRALMHFMNLRLCARAYKEIRALSVELKDKLRILSPEWEWICDELLVPKCEALGYCDEDHTCGRKITKKEMLEAVEAWKKNK